MYLGRSLAVLNDVVGLGLLTQQADANNVTLHTLKRKTDTAPTGAFTTYQSAAGASLWNVDIGGTLTAGIVRCPCRGNIAGQAVGLTDGEQGGFHLHGGDLHAGCRRPRRRCDDHHDGHHRMWGMAPWVSARGAKRAQSLKPRAMWTKRRWRPQIF